MNYLLSPFSSPLSRDGVAASLAVVERLSSEAGDAHLARETRRDRHEYHYRNARVPLQVEALEGRNLPSTVSYVQSLYTNLLNRTGSVPEVAGWEAEINLGGNIGVNLGVPAGQVTNAFVSSAEYLGDVIRNDYQTLLQRTPQPAEVQGWLQQLDNGLGQQQMEAFSWAPRNSWRCTATPT